MRICVTNTCSICGKSKTDGNGKGRKSHPACSRKLQLLYAKIAERKKPLRTMTEATIGYFEKIAATR
jgi:hypothetical protein